MSGVAPAAPGVLVVATNNPGKVAEFGRLLRGAGWEIRSLDQVGFAAAIDEPGPGYEENAVAKAVAVCAAIGLPALADDSGIEVDALGGWPGPRSARWLEPPATDADRMLGLLAEVERRTPADRSARYVCVVALVRPGAEPLTARGECLGTIVAPRGANGFGYDPVFESADLGITFGEASQAEKDGVSHRARALRRLLAGR